MKKRGFTLAEVLITLGIVGVVAALTAPSLVLSSRNEANAARLSVLVSNLENAFQNAIVQEGVDNLYKTNMWSNGAVNADNEARIAPFVGNLGRYMYVSGFKTKDTEAMASTGIHAMDANGGTGTQIAGGDASLPGVGTCIALETKNGATIYIRTYSHTEAEIEAGRTAAIEQGSSYYTNAADVFIDVNGKSAPNTYGRDVFAFQVGENGILYPDGGRDVARMDDGDISHTWDNATPNRFSCTDDNKGSVDAQRGLGCAARVIAEGYKINY